MKKLAYIFLLIAFLSSCVENIEPQLDEDYNSELVVNSVVVPGNPIEFFISTSVPIDSDLAPFNPINDEAEVLLHDQYGQVVVEYTDGVWRTSRVYDPKPGYEFTLSVELTGKNILPIESKTYVPHPVSILEFENTNSETVQINGATKYNYTLNLNIGSSEENIHYRLVPRDLDSLAIPILSIANGTNGVNRLAHMDGILINSNKLIDGNLELVIQSDSDLKKVKLDLLTVNEEYFRYNISLSNAYGSNNSPFDEPVARYSNIDYGLGLFGSYSAFSRDYNLK